MFCHRKRKFLLNRGKDTAFFSQLQIFREKNLFFLHFLYTFAASGGAPPSGIVRERSERGIRQAAAGGAAAWWGGAGVGLFGAALAWGGGLFSAGVVSFLCRL
ncbi:MAG: hypothetical protein IIW73_06805, partial [Clostridia bacterium]|nr:hypothetical protein [Clostridia bacterium]